MTTFAGYSTVIKLGGPSVGMTAEATTTVANGSTGYLLRKQITAAAKRVIDPSVVISVLYGGVPVAANTYVVDYLFGIINFPVSPGASAITVTASYVPLLTVGAARSFSVNAARAELDTSEMGEDFSKFILGKETADGSLERLELFEEDLDPGAGTTTLQALQDAASAVLLEAALGSTGRTFRAWARLPSLSAESSQDDLVKGTTTWKSVSIPANGRTERVSFGFGAP